MAPDLPPESWSQDILTRVGRALDRVLLHGMHIAFDDILMPTDDDLGAIRKSALPYETAELQRDPHRFFAFVDGVAPPIAPTSRRIAALNGGAVWSRSFSSAYEPFHCDWENDVPGEHRNDVVPIQHWLHDDGRPRPTVIALHGFTMGRPGIDEHVLMAPRWYELGLDVALVTLPFHGARAGSADRWSGERFASWNVARLNEAVRQAVHDVWRLRRWLSDNGSGPVGVMGLSLGGYVTALLAALLRDLAFAVPVAAPICLAGLPSRLFAASRFARDDAPAPMSFAELRRGYAVHSPLVHRLRLPRERVLLIGGRGDEVVPPEHVWTLWHHWGQPELHWFSGSHVAPFQRGRIMTAVGDHLRRLGVI